MILRMRFMAMQEVIVFVVLVARFRSEDACAVQYERPKLLSDVCQCQRSGLTTSGAGNVPTYCFQIAEGAYYAVKAICHKNRKNAGKYCVPGGRCGIVVQPRQTAGDEPAIEQFCLCARSARCIERYADLQNGDGPPYAYCADVAEREALRDAFQRSLTIYPPPPRPNLPVCALFEPCSRIAHADAYFNAAPSEDECSCPEGSACYALATDRDEYHCGRIPPNDQEPRALCASNGRHCRNLPRPPGVPETCERMCRCPPGERAMPAFSGSYGYCASNWPPRHAQCRAASADVECAVFSEVARSFVDVRRCSNGSYCYSAPQTMNGKSGLVYNCAATFAVPCRVFGRCLLRVHGANVTLCNCPKDVRNKQQACDGQIDVDPDYFQCRSV